MCEFHDSKVNGLGDIWWTDEPSYFSIIDVIGPQPVAKQTQCVHGEPYVYRSRRVSRL